MTDQERVARIIEIKIKDLYSRNDVAYGSGPQAGALQEKIQLLESIFEALMA